MSLDPRGRGIGDAVIRDGVRLWNLWELGVPAAAPTTPACSCETRGIWIPGPVGLREREREEKPSEKGAPVKLLWQRSSTFMLCHVGCRKW
jgi:hypothetical protein